MAPVPERAPEPENSSDSTIKEGLGMAPDCRAAPLFASTFQEEARREGWLSRAKSMASCRVMPLVVFGSSGGFEGEAKRPAVRKERRKRKVILKNGGLMAPPEEMVSPFGVSEGGWSEGRTGAFVQEENQIRRVGRSEGRAEGGA